MTTYLTAVQAAKKMGIGYTTIIEWAQKGLLPARIIPNGKKCKYFFVDKELDAKADKFKNKAM